MFSKSTKNCVIYALVWKNTDYFYIGQTQSFKKRKKDHFYDMKCSKGHSNQRIQNVYNKYGLPDFHIIEECEKQELNEREQFFIDLLFDNPNCLNISKCVEATTRGLEISQEHKLKISKNRKHKGMKSVKQISLDGELIAVHDSVTGAAKSVGLVSYVGISSCINNKQETAGGFRWELVQDKETKIVCDKKIVSESTRKKLGEIWKGRKHSEQTILKMRESSTRKKSIKQLSLNGEELAVFPSLSEAKRVLGLKGSGIIGCVSGKRKTAGGFRWEYLNKNQEDLKNFTQLQTTGGDLK